MGTPLLAMLVRILYHTLPLWPLLYGRLYLLIAAILAVALPYVKVHKLSAEYQDLKRQAPESRHTLRTARALKFWRYFTFLNPPSE